MAYNYIVRTVNNGGFDSVTKAYSSREDAEVEARAAVSERGNDKAYVYRAVSSVTKRVTSVYEKLDDPGEELTMDGEHCEDLGEDGLELVHFKCAVRDPTNIFRNKYGHVYLSIPKEVAELILSKMSGKEDLED